MEIFLMMLHGFSVAIFLAALIWASVTDLRHFEVPNWLPAAIVLSFAVAALLQGDVRTVAQDHVLIGAATLVIGFVLFAVRLVGGGDVKLLAATALWVGWSHLLPYLFWMALTGGMIALLLILFRRLRLPLPMAAIGWIRNLHSRRDDVPYAVAIALPALFLMPDLSFVSDLPFS